MRRRLVGVERCESRRLLTTTVLVERDVDAADFGRFDRYRTDDVDGDGDVDFIASSNEQITWWENVDGTFHAEHFVAESPLSSLGFADVDGDGIDDLVTATATVVSWYPNTDGEGTFGERRHISNSSFLSHWAITDIDGDADWDIVLAFDFEARIAVFENDGAGNFVSRDVPVPNFTRSLTVSDLDEDGDRDFVVSGQWGTVLVETLADGTYRNTTIDETKVTGQIRSTRVSDVDGDGDRDVVVMSTDGQVRLLRNTGGEDGFESEEIGWVRSEGDIGYLVLEDVDLDNDLDFVAWNGTEVFWLQNESGTFTQRTIGNSKRAVRIVDLDADGQLEVMTIAGRFPRVYEALTICDPRTEVDWQFGDLNLDGLVDIEDFIRLRDGYGSSHPAWADGDLDFDGDVDFSDYLLLAEQIASLAQVAN